MRRPKDKDKLWDKLWETSDRPVRVRLCDHPNCGQPGEYRAPKNRELTAYYTFCLEHVRAYNAAWDYYSGLSEEEIEKHIRYATVWERPSWPLGEWMKREQALRDHIQHEFFGEGFTSGASASELPLAAGEREALAALEIVPPTDFATIKAQYRMLVKRFHPDKNGGDLQKTERFKIINQAFTTLRALYDVDDTTEEEEKTL